MRCFLKKYLYIIIGLICVCLAFVGVVLPLLPTVPFLIIAIACFGKSSKRLNNWLKSTKIYKKNIDSYVKGKGMNFSSKIKVIIIITLLMAFGFVMMKKVFVGKIVIFFVWLAHVIYFMLYVKTISVKKDNKLD